MPPSYADPGYGDPNAPLGSADWAKRWRLEFQSIVKQLPETPGVSREFYEMGVKYRAWTLLTDEEGIPFPDFDAFCAYPQPWGLEMEPQKFRAYLETEMGKRAADLATVAPGDDKGGRPAKGEQNRDHGDPGSSPMSAPKEKRLRAILRAPELVQSLYRQNLVSQTTATMMGPAKPNEEKAAQVVRARQAVEAIPQPATTEQHATYRRTVDQTIRQVMGQEGPTPLDLLRRAWRKASLAEREAFRVEIA